MTMTWGVPLEVGKALTWPVDRVAMHLLANRSRACGSVSVSISISISISINLQRLDQ
ncbi:hypothetical protein [Georgenia faecalis]|uniref:Uncharacterized protein n=1 Tax=Georgenia faecalis TaxID=2483799 RepID=A0ABV9DC74_9MICO|nr:hypothetical protein [Georgenia faecalis]